MLIVRQVVSVFPFRPVGQHHQLVNEVNKDSLALRPAALPSRNLQQSITQILLHSATGVNEQFPGRDFNPLDKLPVTACSLTLSTLLVLFLENQTISGYNLSLAIPLFYAV